MMERCLVVAKMEIWQMRLAKTILAMTFVLCLPVLSGNFKVEKTYNGKPFEYVLSLKEAGISLDIYKISYPSPVKALDSSNDQVHGEFFLPKGLKAGGGHPAVLVLHILHGNFALERMICSTLAGNGIPAMYITMPYYGQRGGGKGRMQMMASKEVFISTLKQGLEDMRRGVDVLCSRPEVDPNKIGATGFSLGAILSASLCGMEPRISRAMLLLGGGNLEAIFANPSRETRAFREFLAGLPEKERGEALAEIRRMDPLSSGPALRLLNDKGRLKMINASEDQVVPPACSRQLADAAGCQIQWLPGANHYTVIKDSKMVFHSLAEFFRQDVPADWKPVAADGADYEALKLSTGFLQNLADIMGGMPAEGKGHSLTAKVELGGKGGNVKASLKYVRGWGGRYVLAADITDQVNVTLAQGEFPWISGRKNVAFRGCEHAVPGKRAFQYITRSAMMKYTMLAGMLAGAGSNTEMLKQVINFSSAAKDNGTEVTLTSKHPGTPGCVKIRFDAAGAPLRADFDIAGVKGAMVVSEWKFNVDILPGEFEPPAGRTVRAVKQDDVLRMIAAAYERLLEEME